jgi:flagellar biosynthesis chaperone FliJ
MNIITLKKEEELTLHLIELNKQLSAQQHRLQALEEENQRLQQQVHKPAK